MAAQLRNSEATIKALRDSVVMLAFPADQRLSKVNRLVSDGNYQSAKDEIRHLVALFPDSKEANATPAIVERIDKLIAQKKAEEERIKALGFKALKAITTVVIDYNKVEFSNISVGSTFTYDSYGDSYYYNTADRGNKYISAAMRITSDSKNPKLPKPAVFSISGDRMIKQGTFGIKLARWDDYGSYLGNYHDNGNDFAKSSSVRFKVGVEVSEDVVKNPYAIILKKENAVPRSEDRLDNPPISYIGFVDYPDSLTLDDFTKEDSQYVIIRIANL